MVNVRTWFGRNPAASRFKRVVLPVLAGFCLLTAPVGGFVLHLVATNNWHVVSHGQIYRSSQMGRADLAQAIREQGIKSILNLRGASENSEWYRDEVAVAKEMGVTHFDYALSARREVTDEQMDELLNIASKAPKPLLIHCKAGADRTGLVAALYLYTHEGKSALESERELGLRCGHFPYLFWRNTGAMDLSFARYLKRHSKALASAASVEPVR